MFALFLATMYAVVNFAGWFYDRYGVVAAIPLVLVIYGMAAVLDRRHGVPGRPPEGWGGG